ncbi:MAG TPA: methyltransferase domain-containing protein [Thermoleophilaceae bacterium]|nr:methyltransferase domain-containing protein [Thermoleophilaceae bacterium]
MTTRAWDAETYDRVSDVQVQWARNVLDRLPLDGDETVLDAGCGSGRVTALLVERLPRGRVIGVDSSEDMAEHAREALGDRARILTADLTELELDEQVDAVFSNAVFHWIADQERLFQRLFAVLNPGGRLVAQCGGEGNLRGFLSLVDEVAATDPFASHLKGFTRTWDFPGAKETEVRMRRSGFDPARAWLEPSRVRPEEPDAFLSTICLGVHLERLPEELHDPFVSEALARAGEPLDLDYVRLNLEARRP